MRSGRLSSICKNQKNERGDTAKRNLRAPTAKKQSHLGAMKHQKDHEAGPQKKL